MSIIKSDRIDPTGTRRVLEVCPGSGKSCPEKAGTIYAAPGKAQTGDHPFKVVGSHGVVNTPAYEEQVEIAGHGFYPFPLKDNAYDLNPERAAASALEQHDRLVAEHFGSHADAPGSLVGRKSA